MERTDVVVHEHPAWRERANFIIHTQIHLDEDSPRWRWEQIWTRQVDANHFEVCCIPFFAYDLALGDVVETEPDDGWQYLIQRVVRRSGHYTFRVWFQSATSQEEVPQALAALGALMEERWPGSKLLAIDAATDDLAQEVADLLWIRMQSGELEYETGKTVDSYPP